MADEMNPEMVQEEKQELSEMGGLAEKLQGVKSLIAEGQNDQAIAMLDECIANLGGMQEQEAEHAGVPDFKEALNSAFTE